mmetsp:Transcript_14703/g.25435  ORF Transcript_14703/g.25435 Transcript_14703/m.25435 type:complete len:470 (-) Transcript_14703:1340-2749(-)
MAAETHPQRSSVSIGSVIAGTFLFCLFCWTLVLSIPKGKILEFTSDAIRSLRFGSSVASVPSDPVTTKLVNLGGVQYPSKIDLGFQQNCSKSLGPRTLEETAKQWNNATWDDTADVSIKYSYRGVENHVPYNPNHMILDSWGAVMYAAINCFNGVGERPRRVSISSLRFVQNMTQCYPTMVKAHPTWQEFFLKNRIGSVVPQEHMLTETEVVYTTHEANCKKAHSFAPSLVLLTAYLLAGPSGSIVELEDHQNQTLAPAENPVRWLIDPGICKFYRTWYELRNAGPVEIKAMKDAIAAFRNLVYHYILPRNHDFSRRGGLVKRCRIALYDRSNETGVSYSRVWQDSLPVQQELRRKFPFSSVVVMPKLPSRFADQVLLFTGVDIVIAVHGGWEPNAMFLSPPTSNKIVFDTRRWCHRENSGIGWISPNMRYVGFEVVELPCQPGSIEDSVLLYELGLPIILDKLKDRCE